MAIYRRLNAENGNATRDSLPDDGPSAETKRHGHGACWSPHPDPLGTVDRPEHPAWRLPRQIYTAPFHLR
eukprot:350494-Chlamydomonas_euryale.AAC.18